MLSGLRKAAGKVGRFLSTTGKSALRKVGDTAQSIRKVGGAINEAFLHIPYLSQFFLAENLSPVDVSHLIALVFFVLLILKYLVKYWSNIFPNK